MCHERAICTHNTSTAHRFIKKDHSYTTSTTHCNTLQHTATHCNTLQHTASIDKERSFVHHLYNTSIHIVDYSYSTIVCTTHLLHIYNTSTTHPQHICSTSIPIAENYNTSIHIVDYSYSKIIFTTHLQHIYNTSTTHLYQNIHGTRTLRNKNIQETRQFRKTTKATHPTLLKSRYHCRVLQGIPVCCSVLQNLLKRRNL